MSRPAILLWPTASSVSSCITLASGKLILRWGWKRTRGSRADPLLVIRLLTVFHRSRNHDWLVESALRREPPANICESARGQNALDLFAQDCPIQRRPVEICPASGCFPRDVQVKHVSALVLPIPNLKHYATLTFI